MYIFHPVHFNLKPFTIIKYLYKTEVTFMLINKFLFLVLEVLYNTQVLNL